MKLQIKNSIQILKQGKLLLYPTDTVWGIGCDATNFDAVQKIYKLKNREETKSMICLVSNIEMLSNYFRSSSLLSLDPQVQCWSVSVRAYGGIGG